MKRAIRYDRGRLLSSKRMPDGTLLCEGHVARPGILLYRRADGSIRRERVTADCLARSAKRLGRVAVTNSHPPEPVSSRNNDKYGVGDIDGEVLIEDDGYIRVKMAVRRQDAIDDIEAGKEELSPGYRVDLDETSGVDPELGPYDATQVDRYYNHVAIVDRARGGSTVRLRADSDDAVEVEEGELDEDEGDKPKTDATSTAGDGNNNHRGDSMLSKLLPLLAVMGITARNDSEDAALADIESGIKGLVAERDQLKQDAAAHQGAIDALQAKHDAEKSRADDAEAKVATLEAAEKARADGEELAKLREAAKAHRIDGADVLDLAGARKALAAKAAPGLDLDGRTDAYIDALVDMALEKAPRADTKPILPKGSPRPKQRNDGERADGEERVVVNLGAIQPRQHKAGQA